MTAEQVFIVVGLIVVVLDIIFDFIPASWDKTRK